MYQNPQLVDNGHYSATVSCSTIIQASKKQVWKRIDDVMGLTKWVVDVKRTEPLSKIHRGVGAIRRITFNDASQVTEYIVGVKPSQYLSYVATSGLPLDVYHATLSIMPNGKATTLNWTSFLNSQTDDKREFEEFLAFINEFYEKSLENLKQQIER